MEWDDKELLLDNKDPKTVEKYAFEDCSNKEIAHQKYDAKYWNFRFNNKVVGTVIFCKWAPKNNTYKFDADSDATIIIKTFYLKESYRWLSQNEENKRKWSEYMLNDFLNYIKDKFFNNSKILWGTIMIKDVTPEGKSFFSRSNLFVDISSKYERIKFINKNLSDSDIGF